MKKKSLDTRNRKYRIREERERERELEKEKNTQKERYSLHLGKVCILGCKLREIDIIHVWRRDT